GEGRMAEPEDLVAYITTFLTNRNAQPLKGKEVLVTAGPTYERIDPVRFIGNFSSGKMGAALAEVLADAGAQVTLVLGPSAIELAHPGIQVMRVESAADMYEACVRIFPQIDLAIMSAAVADYKPAEVAEHKIKKQGDTLDIKLDKTKDILAGLGKIKRQGQIL